MTEYHRKEVWRCMRAKGVPEKYVRLVKDMYMLYKDVRNFVRSSVGETKKCPVNVGLHQGSALSPYLFDIVLDIITEDVRDVSL